jgi:hypothetical protein
MDTPPVAFSSAKVREAIFASNASVQARFRAEYSVEIDHVVKGIAAAHRELDRFRVTAPSDQQAVALELLLHSAINSLLVSTHHLVSGYPISSGNLMRHFTESVAMALLCLEPKLGVLTRFIEAESQYPVHTAPTKLRQKSVRAALKKRIGFDPTAWETVLKISELYDEYSHASQLSLASHLLLDEENLFILGSEFDPAKREFYRSDLVRQRTAAEALAHFINAITHSLTGRSQIDEL